MISERMAKKFCCEDISKIENYEKAIADKTQIWVCHHRNGINRDLNAEGLYWNRPAAELVFMLRREHTALHHLGFKYSDEAKEKLRIAALGNKRALGCKHSEESRRKSSESHKGYKHPQYGMHWYTNGIINVKAFNCPDGFKRGRKMK